ncbi:MAG: hypothetical protein ABIH39_02220 [Candidatus Margulisiibacteriota bacterium]
MNKLLLAMLYVLFTCFCLAIEPAGILDTPVNVTVSGYPSCWETIWAGIKIEMDRRVKLQPACELYLQEDSVYPKLILDPGSKAVVRVQYKIAGQGYGDVDGIATVNIHNTIIPDS